jgi:undecaprenyl-diphosphatase
MIDTNSMIDAVGDAPLSSGPAPKMSSSGQDGPMDRRTSTNADDGSGPPNGAGGSIADRLLDRALDGVVDALLWALPRWAIFVTVTTGLAVALVSTWGAGEVYDAVAEKDGLSLLDRPVLDLVLTLRTTTLDRLMSAFTALGGPVGMPVLATLAAAALALRRRDWTPVVLVTVAAAGSLLMTVVGKPLVGRVRPPLTDAVPPYETSGSFPSGHTLNATVIAGTLVYLLLLRVHGRRTGAAVTAAGALFALAMGLSRVYLGHHWLTDVVAAWLLGLGWLAVVLTGHRLWVHRRRRPG